VYLFDGPHAEQDQYDGIRLVEAALDDEFVLIVDDWNWLRVRKGALRAINDLKMSVLFALEIRTSLDDSHGSTSGPRSDWHNGYFIGVLTKSGKKIDE
jgi:hypothetical protein